MFYTCCRKCTRRGSPSRQPYWKVASVQIITLFLCFSFGALQHTTHTSIIAAKIVSLKHFLSSCFDPVLRLACTVQCTELLYNLQLTSPSGSKTSKERPSTTHHVRPGDFVGLAEEDSTLRSPKILIAQAHKVLENGTDSLLWYKSHTSLFKLELDGGHWLEDLDCLVPVNMRLAKNKPGYFGLESSQREVHRAIHGEDK